jgi:hypothetical protein
VVARGRGGAAASVVVAVVVAGAGSFDASGATHDGLSTA